MRSMVEGPRLTGMSGLSFPFARQPFQCWISSDLSLSMQSRFDRAPPSSTPGGRRRVAGASAIDAVRIRRVAARNGRVDAAPQARA